MHTTRGRADFLREGDWNAVCDMCGSKRKASDLQRNWKGLMVCQEHWEPRHPQDFVRAGRPEQPPSWTRPPSEDTYVLVCTLEGQQSLPGYGIPGCLTPSLNLPFTR